MKKVSAILPVRNMHEFLPRALASLNAQTHALYDIVIADDLSNPSLEEIAAEYGCSYVRNEGTENWGISGGRNAAFALTDADFILPLDADDWVEPTYVEKTIQGMQPHVGIVSTFMTYHGEREGEIVRDSVQSYESELRRNMITVTSLIRSEALRQAGLWDTNLRAWEDWDLWLRILKLGWMHAVVKEPLFHYRVHNSGMNAWAKQPENRQRLYGYMLQKHPDFGVLKVGA